MTIFPVPLHTTVRPYQSASSIPFYLQPTTTRSGIVGHNFAEVQTEIIQLFKSQGFKVDSPKSNGYSKPPEVLLFQPGLRRWEAGT